MPLPEGIRGVLTDIEGTTTPVTFVYDVLFPYAEARLGEAAARAGSDPEIAAAVELLRAEHAAEEGAEGLPDFGDGSPYARHLMRQDRKSTGLKKLQGIIWKAGYADGSLQGAVYPDVPPALEAWHAGGLQLQVFSSGSVLAQKLLFSTTPEGDLTRFFSGFHDTTTGPKKEAPSYRAIAETFGLPPEEILFLSDVVAELDAAREAGMQTALFVRPGNAPVVGDAGHPRRASFAELV